MPTICSFLQSVCQFVRSFVIKPVTLTKKAYRSAAILMSGTMVVAVMTFSSAGFAGGGKNAIKAYAETPVEEAGQEEEKDEEIALITEAKIRINLTEPDRLKSGQLLVGDTLAEDVQKEEAVRLERKEAAEAVKEELRLIEEERARVEAEEKRLKEEAEAVRAQALRSYTASDYDLLKRIVEAEAGGCDIKGRILVANVIINRVCDEEFPNTITGVIYQKSQFSPVSDGRLYSCKVSDLTVEAVDRALSGEDYSQGALYFMNRRRSQSKNVSWFDRSLTYLFDHDGHEFFK